MDRSHLQFAPKSDYRKHMKLCSAVLVLFTLLAVRGTGRPVTVEAADSSKVVLRLLNGKNGKPLRNENPNVWLGNASLINPKTDANGEIALDISRVQPRTVKVFGNYYVDCRPWGSNKQTPMNASYSLDEIVATGIVTENNCGKYHVDPIPGVLVLYLRSMTFKEKWEL